jgi:hypothetical protein
MRANEVRFELTAFSHWLDQTNEFKTTLTKTQRLIA